VASLRKRGDKWQVQVRRKGVAAVSRTFLRRGDAQEWGRRIEVLADRGELASYQEQDGLTTLGDLLMRYRDEVCPSKKSGRYEATLIDAILRRSLSRSVCITGMCGS
jgi:hypothetical protein